MPLLEYFNDWELTPSLGNTSGQSYQSQKLTWTWAQIILVPTPGPGSATLHCLGPSSLWQVIEPRSCTLNSAVTSSAPAWAHGLWSRTAMLTWSLCGPLLVLWGALSKPRECLLPPPSLGHTPSPFVGLVLLLTKMTQARWKQIQQCRSKSPCPSHTIPFPGYSHFNNLVCYLPDLFLVFSSNCLSWKCSHGNICVTASFSLLSASESRVGLYP